MDISKIRKKAKQKENGAKEAPPAESPQKEALPAPAPEPATASAPAPVFDAGAVLPPQEDVEEGGQETGVEPGEAPGTESDETASQDSLVELLTFRLGAEEFAFRVSEVEEIIRHQGTTYVPSTPAYVLGITSLRGKVIPVIDLKVRLNLAQTSYIAPSHAHLVKAAGGGEGAPASGENGAMEEKILIVAGNKGLIGAMIDQVVGVVRVPADEILDPPAHLSEEEMKYIVGVVILDKRFISLIRADMTMDIELR